MKLGKACLQCRKGKRRCDRPEAGVACNQCRARELHCSLLAIPPYDRDLRPASASSYWRTSHEEPRCVLPSPEITDEVVDLYLRYIHDKPHALFQEPTLWQDVHSQQLSPSLLFAILALASRFSARQETRDLASKWTAEAKRLILSDLGNICLENIQACVVIGNVAGCEGDASSEVLFFAMATRMAQMLRLGESSPTDSVLRRETKLRIWWTLWMIDKWSSAGSDLPRQMHDSEKPIEYSMDEQAFHTLSVDAQSYLSPRRAGLWAYMVTLVDLFGPIQDLNRDLVRGNLSSSEIYQRVHTLATNFESWLSALPVDVQLNEQNFTSHKAQGLGRCFVALHLGFYHYSTLLYFQFLDIDHMITVERQQYADRCKEHASGFSDLLRASHDSADCDAVYMIVSHMTVVSSSVLLHTLLFGAENELPAARDRLASNFNILVRLRGYWSVVQDMINRLFTFQNACFWSVDSHTHKIDRWMVKFLLDHALPLDEEAPSVISTSSPTSAAGPLDEQVRQLSERKRFTQGALNGLLV